MQNRPTLPERASKRLTPDSNYSNINIAQTSSPPPPLTELSSALSDIGTPSLSQAATNPRSTDPYTVFISHAGEDKATMAIPLREKLRAEGISAFVDEADIPCGTDATKAMELAMDTARIGVMILSPEFIAKKWPMRELMHFLKRREECCGEGNEGRESPGIIPCFYRLSVADLYQEPKLDPLLCEETRFYERQKNGEAEANMEKIKASLAKLHGIMGIRNDVEANNESSHIMSKRRELLLSELCREICKWVPEGVRIRASKDRDDGRENDLGREDSFRRAFPPKLKGKTAVLDFESRNVEGKPVTAEGKVKKYLVEKDGEGGGIVSLCGLGGVGKSTIVQVLMSDDDIREKFRDGVHLMRLGRDANRNTFFQRMCYILEECGAEKKVERLRERNNIDEVVEFFVRWFEGRRCVLFIDDVWERGVNMGALSRLCDVVRVDGGNMVVMTTREEEIASLTADAKMAEIEPRESRGDVARDILLFHAVDGEAVENDGMIREGGGTISEILDICAGLPVSLAVAGKSVKKLGRVEKGCAGRVWRRYLSQLQASRETLLLRKVGGYGELYATFAATMEFLDEKSSEERVGVRSKFSFAEMHRRLCVLQKQAVVPNTMLMHLWGTESKESAEMIGMVFIEVGLGGWETVQGECESGWRFTLHDSVHEYAVLEARRHGETTDAHNMLLEGYGSGDGEGFWECEDKKVKWWWRGVEDDGYIHKELCRHLVGSGRKKELCELLLIPLWAERQIEVNGVMCLEDDFRIGMKEIEEGEETKEALSLIGDAIRLSSAFVMKNKTEIWFQLHGRLKRCAEVNKEIEEYVKWIETHAPKPRVLSVKGFLMGAGGRNTKIFSVGCSGVWCMALLPDEERVACGCVDGSVVVVNIRRMEIERKWKANKDEVRSIAVVQNGTRVVTLSSIAKGWLDVWDVESGTRAWSESVGLGSWSSFAVSHDETHVVSVSRGRSLQLWDLRTGETVALTNSVDSSVRHVRLFKDGERAITGHDDEKLRIWNIRTAEQIGEIGNGKDLMFFFVVTPDEYRVVSLSYRPVNGGRVVMLWDLKSSEQIWSLPVETDMTSLSVADSGKDGSRIACGDYTGAIHILDMESGDQVCDPLMGHTSYVTGVSFLGNKNSFVSCSLDDTVRVWDISRGQTETPLIPTRHGDLVLGISFTLDGKFVVSGSRYCTIRIWDVASGQAVGDPLAGYSKLSTDVVVTPGGRFVVSVGSGKTVRVWDAESWNVLHTLMGHTQVVSCAAVTPQGDRVVTGSVDRTVRVWDLTKMDGSHVVFEGHSHYVDRVFVSEDGLRVISVDWGGNTFVWSMESQEVLKTAVVKQAWKMSRKEVFSLIGEDIVHDDAGLSIPLHSNEIIHGKDSEARVLATLECTVGLWDISPDKKTICLGLENGRVAFLKVEL